VDTGSNAIWLYSCTHGCVVGAYEPSKSKTGKTVSSVEATDRDIYKSANVTGQLVNDNISIGSYMIPSVTFRACTYCLGPLL
jgi:hypothetical protein